MSQEDEPIGDDSTNRAADRALMSYVNREIRRAKACPCPACKDRYKSWVDWRDAKERGDDPPLLLPPPDFPHPSGPSYDPNDDPPPALNSGNLTKWYGQGL